MKTFRWSTEKNEWLKLSRGVCFENIVVAVESDGLFDIVEPPNKAKYPKQRVLVVSFDGYVYLVPFVEEPDYFFLKTVAPSRNKKWGQITFNSSRSWMIEMSTRLTHML